MSPSFTGHTYLFRVDNGTTFRNSYAADGSSLHYETVAGAGAGSSETVHLHVAELAPGLYFVNWVEASGMAVSHAMNLNTNTVYAFWSWQGEDGRRQGELHTGKLELVR